ncbi:nitric oxide reductase transcriptional regulator NorR [Marinobacterium sedimentorum]|uniref:nitric oxide reductase transcriptional regulator NorR n=1 Tax=Marinobacterium sedimentorum TaxID=2927804 RepID=UPI0020C6A0B8|nr:nitric oxide reductase transcriptional regulator NorR [Marinobacterium sedimentorum]MCP8689488.1 nitric oxide reductase transcriptional regulator NorR [Marinobacterium sedimentorum]
MTTSRFAEPFVEIVADLSRHLSPEDRYQRLLGTFRSTFPCDATALLRLEGDALIPLAIDGLAEEARGRQFAMADHPRLEGILRSRQPIRFAVNSPLPDPYDGLIPMAEDNLHVHDCMGCALYIDDLPWGVITLDALEPGTFDSLDMVQLNAFIHLAEATVKAAELIQKLEHQVQQEHLIAREMQANVQQSMVGHSPAIKALKKEITTVAASDLTVLVCGETGVGKELVARALHDQSHRRDSTLIYVNCAALPENLVESELFGHVKGAFTGASEARSGKFELADGGTLLLDEIGEIPLATQSKLLRVLQSGEIQRVGSDKHLTVDVRVVAATNRDLKAEVSSGRFRADLYHRLSVYPIQVPPLRDRGRDILLLCGYFQERNSRRMGLPKSRLTPECEGLLLTYSWPGNVRELEHCISRALLKARGDKRTDQNSIISIVPEHLDISHDQVESPNVRAGSKEAMDETVALANVQGLKLKEGIDQFQRRWIQALLEQNSGNQAQTARQLGMNRSNFYRLLKRLQLH